MSASRDRDDPLVMGALRTYELGAAVSLCIGPGKRYPIYRNGITNNASRVYFGSPLAATATPHIVH